MICQVSVRVCSVEQCGGLHLLCASQLYVKQNLLLASINADESRRRRDGRGAAGPLPSATATSTLPKLVLYIFCTKITNFTVVTEILRSI